MRATVCGLLLAAGLVVAGWAAWPSANLAADQGLPSDGRGELITQLVPLPNQTLQMLTVIDPRTQSLSVYHINPINGEIELKAVRCLRYDLQVEEFNGVSPLPREIRSLLEQK
ncbi:MAG: hypothetical protein AB7O62_02635 [Pirellulales bacterium]